MKKRFLVLLMLFVLVQLTAQWSDDTELNTAVCTDSDVQFTSSVMSDGSGGMFIVWTNKYTNRDIYFQHVNNAGYYQGSSSGILVCNDADNSELATICDDGNDGVIICWQDDRNSATDLDIYAQRFDSNGTAQWTANGKSICNETGYQRSVTTISDGNGGAILAWRDNRNGNYDVYAQRIDSDGNSVWTADLLLSLSTVTDHDGVPTITTDGAGGAIVSWRRDNNYIYVQRIDAAGNLLWDGSTHDPANITPVVIIVGNAISNASADPTIISDGNNGAYLTARIHGPNGNIYLQRIFNDGSTWTNGVNISNTGGTSVSNTPIIIQDQSSYIFIAWEDYRNGSTADIYVQKINSLGTLQWTSTGVELCVAANNQIVTGITSDGAEGVIISWDDQRDGGDYNIYSQHVNSSGTVQWTVDGKIICDNSANQSGSKMVTNNDNGGIICWNDSRTDASDIYVQCLLENGVMPVSLEVDVNGSGGFTFPDTNADMDFSAVSGNGKVSVIKLPNFPTDMQPEHSAEIYWSIDNNGLNSFTTDITFDYDGHIGTLDEATLKIFRNDGSGWQEWADYTLDTVNNTITANGVTAFSDWGLGDEESTLPVELSSFTAIATTENFVQINWETQSEIDLSGYNIYRNNEANFGNSQKINIELISGNNSSTGANYEYIDEIINASGIVYYWLESVDLDGTIEIFGPVSINFTTNFLTIQNYEAISQNHFDIAINWTTTDVSSEVIYYDIFRNTSLDFENATKLNAQEIMLEGNYNINYEFLDETAQIGVTYFYWVTVNNYDNLLMVFNPLNFTLNHTEFNNFSASNLAESVSLNWQTEYEIEMSSFQILRSKTMNQSEAEIIETFTATNNMNINNYHFVDENIEEGETWFYWIQGTSINQKIYLSERLVVELSYISCLMGSYPNPFNPNTTIKFSVENPQKTKLEIFNILGQKIKSFPITKKGTQIVQWNGKNNNEIKVSSGVYFINLRSERSNDTQKILLMK